MHRVFVYGTLKTNFPNYHFLQNVEKGVSRFIGMGKTTEKFPMVIDSPYHIPFILYKPGHGKNITGEVYEVDDKMLGCLDEIESHPHLYRRTAINVEMVDSNERMDIECYILHDFKEKMLDLPYLSCYGDDNCEAYVPKAKRKSQISLIESVKKVPVS